MIILYDNKEITNMNLKKINLNRGIGDISYIIHLRRLKLIENRDNSFKVFNNKKINNPSKLKIIESEIKLNHSILEKKKLPIFNNMSLDFISHFKELRKLEIERLKNTNKLLINILNKLKNPKLKSTNSQIMIYKSSAKKLKKKTHSLSYMRFSNPFP